MPDVTIFHWVAFCVAVVALLTADLFVFHRHSHEPSLRESAWWTVFWASLGLIFNGIIWWWAGLDHAIQFFNGYVVEKTLSMDNVFVFVVIFSYFRVPLKYQYRVLFWGMLGAILMRLTFVLAASELLKHFEWVLYVFGAFLLYTGVKLAVAHNSQPDPGSNPLIRLAYKLLRITPTLHGEKFFIRENGKLFATPLFLVLLVVESTDVVFAVDSVPAIFGVTKEPFLVFTSNVFAVLGLRALYFLLAGVIDMFRYLNYGLSAVLVFVGAKMLAHDFYHVPNAVSLLIIVLLIGSSIVASLWANRRDERREREMPAESRPPSENGQQAHSQRLGAASNEPSSTVSESGEGR